MYVRFFLRSFLLQIVKIFAYIETNKCSAFDEPQLCFQRKSTTLRHSFRPFDTNAIPLPFFGLLALSPQNKHNGCECVDHFNTNAGHVYKQIMQYLWYVVQYVPHIQIACGGIQHCWLAMAWKIAFERTNAYWMNCTPITEHRSIAADDRSWLAKVCRMFCGRSSQ